MSGYVTLQWRRNADLTIGSTGVLQAKRAYCNRIGHGGLAYGKRVGHNRAGHGEPAYTNTKDGAGILESADGFQTLGPPVLRFLQDALDIFIS